jgi:septal ring factor EnvC (AmiA/AmiB activator)
LAAALAHHLGPGLGRLLLMISVGFGGGLLGHLSITDDQAKEISVQLASVEAGVEKLDGRLARVEAGVEKLDGRLAKVEAAQEKFDSDQSTLRRGLVRLAEHSLAMDGYTSTLMQLVLEEVDIDPRRLPSVPREIQNAAELGQRVRHELWLFE